MILLYQCLVLSRQSSLAEKFHQAPDEGPVGGSRDRVQAVRSGGGVGAARHLHSILLLQDAHGGCGFEVLQPHGLLLQQLQYLGDLLDLRPHLQICS